MKKKCLLFLMLSTLLFSAGSAQQTAVYDDPGATYREALDLFSKEKFGAARKLFLQVIQKTGEQHREIRADAKLHAAICAAELFNPDAEHLMLNYIQEHPAHHGQKLAAFYMGNIKYRQGNFLEASAWYNELKAENLSVKQGDEFLFKKAYSLFMNNEHNTAEQLFSRITDTASQYFKPASYYLAHLAYLNKEHDRALQLFERLKDHRQFGQLVPFYVVHIYFLEKRYDELLAVAPELLNQAPERRKPEIARIIGETYFEKSQYENAIPYFETFINSRDVKITAKDRYQMGYAYFITGRFEQAIPQLEKATGQNDAMAQNAYFHLGYSFIQTDQKRFAHEAFLQAQQMNHIEVITRESLFLYAQLTIELSYDPFNKAINLFNEYITKYPDSPRHEEAIGYIVDLYLTTRNFKDALASLEKTTHDTPKLREAYQQVSYSRGIELFNNGDFNNAITHFEKTRQYSDNQNLFSSSLFWEAEALFRLERYNEARTKHEQFLRAPRASSLGFYHQAHYSIGYTHFKEQSYTSAIPAFRRFINAPNQDRRMLNDATLRMADAYFINKSYQNALDYYNRAISLNLIDTDYAVFQQGLVHGIMGNFEAKIASMRNLLNNYPQSTFIDDGMYELANSWLILNNSDQAKRYFQQLIERHPNSNYVKSAMLKTGLIFFNSGEDERAISMFMDVIKKHPATIQAQEALDAIQIIYVGLDRVDEFVKLTREMGVADITTARQDSLTYQAAENRYLQGDCTNAVQSFSNYLDKFPNGVFAVNAQFYRAECYFRTNEHQRAYEGYKFVAEAPRSKFLENALLRASSIQFESGHFESALGYFYQLEENASYRNNLLVARQGKMRSYYRMQRYEEAIGAADKVLSVDKISSENSQEAHLIHGLSAMQINNTDMAKSSLSRAKSIADNIRAAEAMYSLALITFKNGDYEAAEQQIFEYINRLTAYDYWLARMFLLLADVYFEKDNTFQAKHTLQSIIDNYDGEELRNEARRKLEFITEYEQMTEPPVIEQVKEIDMNESQEE